MIDNLRWLAAAHAANVGNGVSLDLWQERLRVSRLLPSSADRDACYVYRLRCPRSLLIRYIGSSYDVGRRYLRHCYASRPHACRDWVLELVGLGLLPLVEVVTPPIHYASACRVESTMIRRMESASPGQLLNRAHTGRLGAAASKTVAQDAPGIAPSGFKVSGHPEK